MIRMLRPHCHAVVAGLSLLLLAGVAGAEARTRVALLPVVVHSMEDPSYLRAGLGDMLAARLSLQPELQVVRVSDTSAATTDLAAAQAAARAAGAQFVVFGSFTRFGEGASLDLQCASTSGEGARQIFVQSGAVGDLIPRLDDLAQRVAYYVKNGEAPAVSTPPPASPGGGVARSDLEDLRRRVEALERAQRNAVSAADREDR